MSYQNTFNLSHTFTPHIKKHYPTQQLEVKYNTGVGNMIFSQSGIMCRIILP